ncbi:DUF3152 domain-containing protein [Nocardiopsis sediminis]|uniref:DUF3152 domain-containing protein n=1 Tax=Nocardiopsis sediminis TaxID=1778267 RepID=A0ABV8FKH9_9ACTN
MSTPAPDTARERRPRGRHRRRWSLESLLGLAVILAAAGLLVLERTEPEPRPHGPGERAAAAEPEAPPSEPPPFETPVLLRSVVDEVREGSGNLEVVEGEGEPVGDGVLRRYLVEVERGLPGDPEDFANAVEQILGDDDRGWPADDDVALQRVDSGPVAFRVTLAAPNTTDELCTPLRTGGFLSCSQDDRVVINQNRWVSGVEHFGGDLETYRTYVVNHEVGHALGHGHVNCTGRGDPAPVMQQQTFALNGCEPNGLPFP